MAVNKVVYGTTVLVDLTKDTVTADKLLKGATAHNAAGELITGTHIEPVTYYKGKNNPSSNLGKNGDIYLQNVEGLI